MSRAVFTGGLGILAQEASQGGSPRDLDPGVQGALAQIGLKLHNPHGRNWRQIIRVNHVEQRLRKSRVFQVDLQLDPRRHVGEAFEQALDIRIRTLKFLDEPF